MKDEPAEAAPKPISSPIRQAAARAPREAAARRSIVHRVRAREELQRLEADTAQRPDKGAVQSSTIKSLSQQSDRLRTELSIATQTAIVFQTPLDLDRTPVA
jgi:hypothetical protein